MPDTVGLQMQKLAELFSDSENFLKFEITEDNYNAYFLYALKYDGGLADKLTNQQWAALLATKENANLIDTAKLADMLANFPNLVDCSSLQKYLAGKLLSSTKDLSAEQANLMFNMGFAETTRFALKEIITSHRQNVLAKVQSCVDNNDAMAGIVESISNATDKESIDKEVLRSIFADIKAQMDEGTLSADSTETVHVNRAGKEGSSKDGSSRIAGKIAKYSYLLTADGQIIITPKGKTSATLGESDLIRRLNTQIQEKQTTLNMLSQEYERARAELRDSSNRVERKKRELEKQTQQIKSRQTEIEGRISTFSDKTEQAWEQLENRSAISTRTESKETKAQKRDKFNYNLKVLEDKLRIKLLQSDTARAAEASFSQIEEIINQITDQKQPMKSVTSRRVLLDVLRIITDALGESEVKQQDLVLQEMEKKPVAIEAQIASNLAKREQADKQLREIGRQQDEARTDRDSAQEKLREIFTNKSKRQALRKFAGSEKKVDRVVTLSLPNATAGLQVEGQVLIHGKVKDKDPNNEEDKQYFIEDVKSDDHRARQVAPGYFLTKNKGLSLVGAVGNGGGSREKKPIAELVQRTFAQVIASQKREQIMGDIKAENIFSGNPCVIFDQRDRNKQKVELSTPLAFTPDEGSEYRYGSVPPRILSEDTVNAFQLACKSAQDKGSDISYLDTFGMLGALVIAEGAYRLDKEVCMAVKEILQTMRDVYSDQEESFNLERTADNKDELPLLHEVLCRKMKNGGTIGDALGGPAVFDITLPNGMEKFADLGKDEIKQLPQIFTEQLIRAEYKEGFTAGSMPEIAAAPAPTGILSALQATAQTHSSPSPSIASSRGELIQAEAAKLREGSARQKYHTLPGEILAKRRKAEHTETYYSTQVTKLDDKNISSGIATDLGEMKAAIEEIEFDEKKYNRHHYEAVKKALQNSNSNQPTHGPKQP